MTRRRFSDPVARLGMRSTVVEQIDKLLIERGSSTRDVAVIRLIAEGTTLREIGRDFNISPESMKRLRASAIRRARQTCSKEELLLSLADELAAATAAAENSSSPSECGGCGAVRSAGSVPVMGRPRVYCSNACRQKAYRARVRERRRATSQGWPSVPAAPDRHYRT